MTKLISFLLPLPALALPLITLLAISRANAAAPMTSPHDLDQLCHLYISKVITTTKAQAILDATSAHLGAYEIQIEELCN